MLQSKRLIINNINNFGEQKCNNVAVLLHLDNQRDECLLVIEKKMLYALYKHL